MIGRAAPWIGVTRAGDRPERILHTPVEMRGDWRLGCAGPVTTLAEPEAEWEGGALPLARSERGQVSHPVRQPRDPYVFDDAGDLYIVYAIAGEQGLALARLEI